MIGIIDYGLGNVKAFLNVFKSLNISATQVKHSEELFKADKLLLPGVGSFDYAMQRLIDSGMRDTLDDIVLNKNIPVLGVCVGMQIMSESSEEGKLKGLGWINSEVRKFDFAKLKAKVQVPHMGWNDVTPVFPSAIMKNLEVSSRFYFLHSYYFHCKDPGDIIATTDYGIKFASAVKSNNIYGVQFHPEKSHLWGVQLLKNFAELNQC